MAACITSVLVTNIVDDNKTIPAAFDMFLLSITDEKFGVVELLEGGGSVNPSKYTNKEIILCPFEKTQIL